MHRRIDIVTSSGHPPDPGRVAAFVRWSPARIAPDRSQRTAEAALDVLPDGVFVTLPAWGEGAYLVRGEELLAWSHGGYRERRRRPKGEEARVLTPPSTVKVIRAGYLPDLHPSTLAST